jgi:guanine deaminase
MGLPTSYTGTIWNVSSPRRGVEYVDASLDIIAQGALVVQDGKILFCGEASSAKRLYPEAKQVDFSGSVILPGFVDTHLHMPQLDIIGSESKDLLEWLNAYTFPKEREFHDRATCLDVSQRLILKLLENGITLSAIFAASSEISAEVLFGELERSGLRAIVGKVSMDRNAPANILQSAKADYDATKRLIDVWHGKDNRLFYALTPRFAPSCTSEMLNSIGSLKAAYPDLYVQTHISESMEEIQLVRTLFPNDADYLAVYENAGIHSSRTIYAHGIHLGAREIDRIRASGAAIAHCPTSNSFLGSGRMPLRKYLELGLKVSLASDIGGGTSLSPWRTMAEAYFLASQLGARISSATALYLATLGGAECLDMHTITGSLDVGKDADFQVINLDRNSYLNNRRGTNENPENLLLALMMTGDDRLTESVFVRGRQVYSRR